MVGSTVRTNSRPRGAVRAAAAVFCAAAWLVAVAGDWRPLRNDQLHDPKGAGVRLLQEPREALSQLPPDSVGNQVRWIEAIEKGAITPRTALWPETEVRLYEKDVLLNLYGSMPIVRFPHRRHTLWLDCNNCHEHPFKSEAGATPISMLNILEGEQCGLCHGAVAFPLTECGRCHSVSRQDFRPPPKLKAIVVPDGELPAANPPAPK